MKATYVLVTVLALGFWGCGGCGKQEAFTPTKELASETIEKSGDTWHVAFTSKIDAPPDKVFEAFSQPERGQEFVPDNIRKSELVSQNGNTKVVDIVGTLDILPPGFKTQQLRTEYTLHPEEKRITAKSIDFKLADINSEWKFTPLDGGKATLVTFTETSKDKQALPVESLQKGALRETYVTQIKAVNRALGLEPMPKAQG
jgi:ribosome-associated toxin RatA of RatAB toxin-antitoxin module